MWRALLLPTTIAATLANPSAVATPTIAAATLATATATPATPSAAPASAMATVASAYRLTFWGMCTLTCN